MKTAIVVTLICVFLPAVASAAAMDWCRYGKLPVPESPQTGTNSGPGLHTLAIFYAVPNDVPYNPAVLARIKLAAANVQAWYQCASGGMTWEFAFPETVHVYNALQNRLYYKNNGDWWGSLLPEMGAAGLPIWTTGTVAAVWAHGAGFWAGAAQFCGVDCGGALFGVELFPEFNNSAYSGGACPGGSGVAAWPCTPEGAFAHELGHTLGLPHPADLPATNAVAPHSVMQTHWNYPNFAPAAERPWGFLTVERQTMMSNPFMQMGVATRQPHAGCDIVNLPVTGAVPVASFTRDPVQPPFTFHGINTSTGAGLAYWLFGDGSNSNATDGLHTYATEGAYPVTLRVMAGTAMMDSASAPFVAPSVDVASGVRRSLMLSSAVPNPFTRTTACAFDVPAGAAFDLAVYEITGRRVRSLRSGGLETGHWRAEWDGLDEDQRRVRPGVYFIRLRAGGRAISKPVVLRD